MACTVCIDFDFETVPSAHHLRERLEDSKIEAKREALEELILLMIQGEDFNKLLITVIRFIAPSNDKRLKKLLNIYWELIEKLGPDGKPRDELLLVCNSIKSDLEHANEYVRGSTLRLITKIKCLEIVMPLVESITNNLSHRHSYVRRNAVTSVYSIVKTFGMDIIPDAVERMTQLMAIEGDLSTKRNAFIFLTSFCPETALELVTAHQNQLVTGGDLYQLAVLDLIRKLWSEGTSRDRKASLLRMIALILGSSSSTAVTFEAAASMVALTKSPSRVELAVSAYVKLLNSESDNNVKLIILTRLQKIFDEDQFLYIAEKTCLDILRALQSMSLEIRKRVVEIALRAMTNKAGGLQEVIEVLYKEALKDLQGDHFAEGTALEYRKMLIRTLREACSDQLETGPQVLLGLLPYLTENHLEISLDILGFLREVLHRSCPHLVLESLLSLFTQIQEVEVLRAVFWLIGEFCVSKELAQSFLAQVVQALEPFPLESQQNKAPKPEQPPTNSLAGTTVVLQDGTYGVKTTGSAPQAVKPGWRSLICTPGGLLAASLASFICKLSITFEIDQPLRSRLLYIIANLIKLEGDQPTDTQARLTQCFRRMMGDDQHLSEVFQASHEEGLQEFRELVVANHLKTHTEAQKSEAVPPDCPLLIRHLLKHQDRYEDEVDTLNADQFFGGDEDSGKLFGERIAKTQQMTGVSDPLYIEGFLKMRAFSLLLEVLVINRTNSTIQNIRFDLCVHGELTFVEKPMKITLAPGGSQTLTASLKIAATERASIFGYVSYETNSADDKETLVLNEIKVDVLDFIRYTPISAGQFRSLWQGFEWENKVDIHKKVVVRDLIQKVMLNSKLALVGVSFEAPEEGTDLVKFVNQQMADCPSVSSLMDSSSFIATNLYTRSIFGEDVLVNLSVEKKEGLLMGSFRIRSREQGVALVIGDQLSACL